MQFSRRPGLSAGTTLTLIAGAAAFAAPAGAQVNAFNFFKVGYYNQTGATTQALQNYFFDSTVFEQNPTDATTATLNPGAGTQVSYSYTATPSYPGADFGFNSPAFASQATLDTSFPQGIYTVNYGGGTETPGSFAVNYSTDGYAASNPLFTAVTFDGLQNLDASKPFTLNWNANTSATANDPNDFLEIYDATTGTNVYDSGFLAPNVMSVTLPANLLQPGTSYNADLNFSDRIDGPNTNVTDTNGNNIFVTQAFDLHNTVNFTTAIPEPSPLALLALGVLPLGLIARRKIARRAA